MIIIHEHIKDCNKLHSLVDDYYEALFTESGNVSKSTKERVEALEELIYACIKIKNSMEEADTSNSVGNNNSIKHEN